MTMQAVNQGYTLSELGPVSPEYFQGALNREEIREFERLVNRIARREVLVEDGIVQPSERFHARDMYENALGKRVFEERIGKDQSLSRALLEWAHASVRLLDEQLIPSRAGESKPVVREIKSRLKYYFRSIGRTELSDMIIPSGLVTQRDPMLLAVHEFNVSRLKRTRLVHFDPSFESDSQIGIMDFRGFIDATFLEELRHATPDWKPQSATIAPEITDAEPQGALRFGRAV